MGRGMRTLLLGCGGLLVAACLCVGVVSVATGQLLGGLLGVVNEVIQPPYGVGSRPLPAGPLTETMLPPQVGGFMRGALARAAAGGNQATYDRDGLRVDARAVYYTSATEAQEQVRRIYQALTSTRTVSFLEQGDPTTLRVVYNNGRARMVWSRGRYLFDVQAPAESGLDAFMTAFPY